ncbi:uncharacterized protein [Mytilus edulis]|uniref:uncharacterized protein n=1 Tax=Mytilus edulis TaxID=6550 RepID=UPI0039F053B3
MGKWKSELFGCFKNSYLSLMTYVAPCYVAGRNAEEVGYSCKTLGVLFFVPFIGSYYNSVMRTRIREQNRIDGNRLKDFCVHTFCYYCALIQDAQELEWWKPREPPKNQKVTRK